mgnify:CR=1 FL=1
MAGVRFTYDKASVAALAAAGFKQGVEFATEYVLATDTASYWLGNLVRMLAQDKEYVSGRLGPQHMDLELYDVLRIQHPMIQGSEGLYQITRLQMHPLEGWVSFAAAELLQVNGS